MEGVQEYGNASMPLSERSQATSQSANICVEDANKTLHLTSRSNGRACAAAGKAGVVLRTMAVLQAYQVNLLKDLDQGQGLLPEAG